jgi:predicted amino acid-binding ACT domain protein
LRPEGRRNARVILKSQAHVVRAAETIVRGLATVGIIALIDEVTGYQKVRDRLTDHVWTVGELLSMKIDG